MKLYRIENRGVWTYHWFYYTLCSFRFLENIEEKPNILITFLTDSKDMQYCYESLEYFKNNFNIYFKLEEISNIESIEIIDYHGEEWLDHDVISSEGFTYLRKIILSQFKSENKFMNERIYIKRNNQSKLSFNIIHKPRRNIINENELIEVLTNIYNFKCIDLEDYTFNDKVEIFQNSSIIISVAGGSLSFATFANMHTKIIELFPHHTLTNGKNHFKNLCEVLSLNYERFIQLSFENSNNGTDSELNINIESFKNYMNTII